MDLKNKNNSRNKAYKIADDAIELYGVLKSMKNIQKEIWKQSSNKKIKSLEFELEKLNRRRWHLELSVQYCNINDSILNNIFIKLEESKWKSIKER